MLFNSYEFFAFLLVVLAGFHGLQRVDARASKVFLVVASIVFYGWWKPIYVLLLLGSLVGNYLVGVRLRQARGQGRATRPWLAFGIAGNLALIGYFKYAGFLAESVNALAGAGLPIPHVLLPLAISFFTFQQIAYLVDVSRGETGQTSLLDYALFVTFFPQLIAGPIVHHKEVLPQFERLEKGRAPRTMTIGITLFVLGLFKKVVLADGVAPFADAVFGVAAAGTVPSFGDAWLGALAYTLQIYFDFSGYSDMALGLGQMFGIRLPVNFYAPYQASSIIEFWRRWHITLSRFLRDYLYIPLGGSRHGWPRRLWSLSVTMLLGGLWHGAGWTFVVWGALHGAYLIINHGWRRVWGDRPATGLGWLGGRVVTFAAVVVAWVFFRAADFQGAERMLAGLAGFGGLTGSVAAVQGTDAWHWVLGGLIICWVFPSTVDVLRRHRAVLDPTRIVRRQRPGLFPAWRPSPLWAAVIAALGLFSLLSLSRVSPFLYFRF